VARARTFLPQLQVMVLLIAYSNIFTLMILLFLLGLQLVVNVSKKAWDRTV